MHIKANPSVKYRHGAFTLVELMIVMIIIGILSGMLLMSSFSMTNSAEAIKIIADMRDMKTAAFMYNAENGTWPVWLYLNGEYVNRDSGNETIMPDIYLGRLPVQDEYWLGVMKHPDVASASLVVADLSYVNSKIKEALAKASDIDLYGTETIVRQAPDLSSLTKFKASDNGMIWIISK